MSESPSIPPRPPDGDKIVAKPVGEREGARKPPAPPPLPPQPATVEPAPDEQQTWWSSGGRTESSAWFVSFLVHAVALFLLGLLTLNAQPRGTSLSLLASTSDAASGPSDIGIEQQPLAIEPDAKQGDSPSDTTADAAPVDVPIEIPKIALSDNPSKISNDRSAAPGDSARASNSANALQRPTGGGFEGRDPAARPGLAGGGGGSKESELAVERGLRWLAGHQREDGGWSFDLTGPPCNGMCRNSGREASTTAATGLALLPFLGAGYTHLQGEHQETIKKGLYYLSQRAMVTSHGIDLRDGGNMYAQGIATLALCEAYGMTRDVQLKEIAQRAIHFIVYAQDLQGGGWRYTPGSTGDTTVTGWQLMALKSGQIARLEVPTPTIGLAIRFLDSVQYEKGARYGYLTATQREPKQEATTAVGLLCRMYTGWHRDRPALYQGTKYLHRWGPSKTNMYYDYYATQVLHHWQGPEWQAWNKPMRDYLVATQATNSHEAGSWFFPDHYGDRGGRLYNTAMAIMILEVYYRHMPLYGEKAVRDRF